MACPSLCSVLCMRLSCASRIDWREDSGRLITVFMMWTEDIPMLSRRMPCGALVFSLCVLDYGVVSHGLFQVFYHILGVFCAKISIAPDVGQV